MAHATLGVGLTTATARTILGIGPTSGRAEQVAQRLGEAIRLGLILDGERLPSEVQLAEQLGIATVTLRAAGPDRHPARSGRRHVRPVASGRAA